MLDDKDQFVRFLALSTLNDLEFGHRFMVPERELPCKATEYKKRRRDRVLRDVLINNLSAAEY